MRISDLSSDVCSSDLKGSCPNARALRRHIFHTWCADMVIQRLLPWRALPMFSDYRLSNYWQRIALPAISPERQSLNLIGTIYVQRSEEHTSELQSLMRI